MKWTGNEGSGTSGYTSYTRDHVITSGLKRPIEGSSDPAFRGDVKRWNPEELLVASISACHKLWYLHLCSASGVTVLNYTDVAEGVMEENETGGGHFVHVILRPHVTICTGEDRDTALRLHRDAHSKCFIANSVNFPVTHDPVVHWENEVR
ncbi:organic hydroperoxide reductase OsmC/OhrA [Granulicella aggregans]|uniref:Organic hydroperoxide reductase OsmC/OhrA n=1 Tax=Granulicella aggregans TaxID=474949 RepID=A0A7W7ZHR9_9BACT|nr:organic hydroperoxide reductase OsmC/OhrA [Granulicella aggregans]